MLKMPENPACFTDLPALLTFVSDRKKGALLITYRHCPGYQGMMQSVMLVFDSVKGTYDLDLQWSAFGLDLYGDTLQESYVYRFQSLEQLTAYLQQKYDIPVSGIPYHYKINPDDFPNPIKDHDKKLIFEEGWQKFEHDYRNGVFLDESLQLIYPS